MKVDALTRYAALAVASASAVWAAGCSNDFGQPCELPQTEEFRQACSTTATEAEGESSGSGTEIEMESKASCAVKNFAGCATRVCLVYRGSDPFCSEPCVTKADCEGSAECRPILGDTVTSAENICERTECYCVRKGDVDN